MILPGQVVILDGGTTCVQLARCLPPTLAITVVTHSPSIAVELVSHPLVEVLLIGGRLFKHSMVAVGASAVEAMAHIRADVYFMGVTGVHPTEGLSTGDLEEAYVKRALAARAAEVVVLASTEKLGAASPYVIADIDTVSSIVVDRGAPDAIRRQLQARGVAVVVA
jgi:DeoR/GlpR family transcriptional regulator of sugar metabolism